MEGLSFSNRRGAYTTLIQGCLAPIAYLQFVSHICKANDLHYPPLSLQLPRVVATADREGTCPQLLDQHPRRFVVAILLGEAEGGPALIILCVNVCAVHPHQHSRQPVIRRFSCSVERRSTLVIPNVDIGAVLAQKKMHNFRCCFAFVVCVPGETHNRVQGCPPAFVLGMNVGAELLDQRGAAMNGLPLPQCAEP